ncbi:MAG: hypothetical protein CMP48_06520 [Rickettsiales bacterium]|nr:hypothetical protein [Rickettsiales bacterium]
MVGIQVDGSIAQLDRVTVATANGEFRVLPARLRLCCPECNHLNPDEDDLSGFLFLGMNEFVKHKKIALWITKVLFFL